MNTVQLSNTKPTNYVANNTDCDDTNGTINPNATEICDGVDNDCDGLVDDDDLSVTGQATYYSDLDLDGYGDINDAGTAYCSDPGSGYSLNKLDCNDANASISPGTTELVGNNIDENCDGKYLRYVDADNDGYGSTTTVLSSSPTPAPGESNNNLDCNDANASINPGATEVCDGVDNDCDVQIDEGLTFVTYYRDGDSDGYGDPGDTVSTCDGAPSGYVSNSDDCDDNNFDVNPDADEIVGNGVDDDCDPGTSDSVLDVDDDGDGFSENQGDCNDANASISPGATELVGNNIDENCDGKYLRYVDADNDSYGSTTTVLSSNPTPAPGESNNNLDCNDGDSAINPGATEVCDGKDNDCDTTVDEGVTTTYYADTDSDGYGNASSTTQACSAPAGFVSNSTDCNDGNASIYPGATETADNGVDEDCDGFDLITWYQDSDSDSYGNASVSQQSNTKPSGYVSNSTDCDDTKNSVYPNAPEICDGLDNDCDGTVDEGVKTTFYADTDGDGYGNPASTVQACSAPSGYVSNSTDCDDTKNSVHPNAPEICDGLDNDCDGTVDEGVKTTYYADADGDGYGNPASTIQACSAPSGYVSNSTDCDDTKNSVYPDAPEICDGLDNDCDGTVDEGVKSTFYADTDGDGYGNPSSTIQACSAPSGYVSNSTDCDDSDNTVYPGAPEPCDGKDNDCDTTVDEGVTTTDYADTDSDGYGNASSTTQACSAPAGFVSNSTDCNDGNASIYPGATETADNGVDEDCDGFDLKTWYQDSDSDSYGNASVSQQSNTKPSGYVSNTTDCDDTKNSVYPNAPEICDGLDNDCDGTVDEGVKTTYYADVDGDGYGNPATTVQACSAPSGYVSNNTDCDDTKASVHPGATEIVGNGIDDDCDPNTSDSALDFDDDGDGFTENEGDCNDANAAVYPNAPEICDGLDNDCDGTVDEGVKTTYYADADGDGYGNPASTIQVCSAPSGYVSNSTDCDDAKNSVYPNAPEICDGMTTTAMEISMRALLF